ncbi:MAG TPA: hypothetical protein VLM37_03515, partial [Fibrobacteraceae bacterium]|nr:hypothetical protein [Fibrobacteraceae bacterium]
MATSDQPVFGNQQDGTVFGGSQTQPVPTMAQPYLVVLFPSELYNRYALDHSPMVLGRGQEADICIPD